MNRPTTSSSNSPAESHIVAKQFSPWGDVDFPRIPRTISSTPQLLTTDQQPRVWVQKAKTDGVCCSCTCHCNKPYKNPSFDPEFKILATGESNPTARPSKESSIPYRSSVHDIVAYERSYESVSPQNKGSVVALPGTMSSRGTPMRPRIAPPHKRQCEQVCRGSIQDSPTLGRRLSSAVKELFRKDAIEDNQLENIDDRHWSED